MGGGEDLVGGKWEVIDEGRGCRGRPIFEISIVIHCQLHYADDIFSAAFNRGCQQIAISDIAAVLVFYVKA